MEEKDINKNCDCHDCADECGENCSCNHEETDSIVIEMEDENGGTIKVEVIGTFDNNDKSYAIVNDLDNPNNSYIFEVQSTDNGDVLVSIDDEEEFDRLCGVIEELTK